MFTPQKLWSLTPRSEAGRKKTSVSVTGSGLISKPLSPSNGEASTKGKNVGFNVGDGIMDQELLNERLAKLEDELFEYQYNLGLLLIEKKEWTAKYEELSDALADASDSLKREQIVHASAMSEVEKREDNLKKALGVERQCVLDLEKAIHEMRSEYAEVKFNADSKLAEANALATSVEEKALDVEAKFHAADAKLAEVNRKSSEIEMKLRELGAQENVLRRDRSFFATEREAHDATISKQREDLREWERKLQESEERQSEGRRLLNQREERANENDKLLREKQNNLEELRKKVELVSSDLRNKEDDISSRLASLAIKEKETDIAAKRLEDKEKQLLELEDKLVSREKYEMQKLLDEHKSSLVEKQKEYEMEMEIKKRLLEEELKNKLAEVEKKEVEVSHMEEKLKKREQATETKLEKVKEKETELDFKWNDLKEREKNLKVEEKKLEIQRKEILDENKELLNIKSELEKLKTETETLEVKLREEKEQLKVTEDERREYVRLQSELKQEIEKYRFQNEQLLTEADGLKLEKEKFEKEWEELDDKRTEIKKEQADVLEQKRYLEKLRLSEEERLQTEKQETQLYIQRELEALKLAKESFTTRMEQEESILAEKLQSEKSQLIHDFEKQKQELEAELQRKQENIESRLLERENLFVEKREKELNEVNNLREVARREMEEMKLQRDKIEKENLEISQNKDHLEAQQREMKKDIEELVGLSQKLKDQREQFIKERERFTTFAEKLKSCSSCGEAVREFVLSDLHPLTDLENFDDPPLPKLAKGYLEVLKANSQRINPESSPVPFNSGSPVAGGTISWLRKCTSKIFKFSPAMKLPLDDAQGSIGASAQPFIPAVNDYFDRQIVGSDSGIREVETVKALSDHDPLNIPENSENSVLKEHPRRLAKVGRPGTSRTRSSRADSRTNGNREDSVHTNDESRAESDFIETQSNRRKRTHGESQAAVSDDLTQGQSDSVKDGDRPKRRQRVAATESFVQKRYNLRQTKKSAATVANGSFPQGRTEKEKGTTSQLPGVGVDESQNFEIGAASREEINEPGATTRPSEASRASSDFSADSPAKNAGSTDIGHVDPLNASVNGRVSSEGVNGTPPPEGSRQDNDDDTGDEDEVDHPGEVSVGKKLWTFLTT